MASIKRIDGKNGAISFKITVCVGRDENGKQIRHFKTWKPSKPMSEKTLNKEVNKIAYEFERELKQGFQVDNKQTFSEYAEYVCKLHELRGDKQSSLERFQSELKTVNKYIGNIKIVDIRPQYLNRIIQELMRKTNTQKLHAVAKADFNMIKGNLTQTAFAEKCGIPRRVLISIISGDNISLETAHKVENALNRKDLFEYVGTNETISTKMVSHYFGVIKVVLEQARKEMIVQYNAASLATLPKMKNVREQHSLTAEELKAIFEALETEPIEIKTLIHIFIVTGCRRGEVLAMKWNKLDIDRQEITIDESVTYTVAQGVIIGSTKTDNTRKIPLTAETMRLLEDYRREQIKKRYVAMCSLQGWIENDLIFSNPTGEPKHPTTANNIITSFSNRHNLPPLHPHLFRHTLASTLISNGVDVLTVSQMLGHSNATTTLSVYSHAIEDNRKKAAECVEKTILQYKNA